MIICKSSMEGKNKAGIIHGVHLWCYIYLYRLQLFTLIKQAMLAEVFRIYLHFIF